MKPYLRLMLGLITSWSAGFNAVAVVVYGLLAQDSHLWQWCWAVYAAAIVLGSRPPREGYVALNLPMRLREQHYRLLATGYFLLALVSYPFSGSSLPYLLPVLAIVWVLLRPRGAEAIERAAGDDVFDPALAPSEGTSGSTRLAATPHAQLVVRPLVRTWLVVLLASLATVLALLVFRHFFGGENFSGAIGAVIWMGAMVVAGTSHSDSFRDYVTFGGSRLRWARTAVFLSLIPVGAAALTLVAARAVAGQWITGILAFGLCIVPAMVSPCLADKKRWTWLPTVLLYLGFVGVGALWIIAYVRDNGSIPPYAALLASLALYAVWLPMHFWQARRHDPFAPSLDTWFGLTSRA